MPLTLEITLLLDPDNVGMFSNSFIPPTQLYFP